MICVLQSCNQLAYHTRTSLLLSNFQQIQIKIHVYTDTYTCAYPGGKVSTISREALARGDIARDPTRSRQIPWLCMRLREMMEWHEAAGLRDLACL